MTKEQIHPDQAAQEAVWTHSASYSCILRILEATCGCVTTPMGEICCTRVDDPEYYGAFGVYLKGEVTAMFTQDVYSCYNKDTKKRECNLSEHDKFQVFKYEDLKPSLLDPTNPDAGYTESWVIPREVLGIWIYKSALKKQHNQVYYQKLLELGLPVTIIED